MDQRLKDFALQGFIDLPNKAKKRLLHLLKHQPEIMFQIISNNLEDWVADLRVKNPEMSDFFIHNHKQDCQEILECLQKHYISYL